MLRQAAAGAALVAAAAAALLWEPAIQHEPVRLAPRAAPEVSVAVAAAPAGTPLGAPTATTPVHRLGLAAAYGQATDIRQFALEAMQRPQEGGLFYARRALSTCFGADQATMDASIRRMVELAGTVSAEQMRVADAAVRRCASLQAGEAEALFKRAVLQSRDGSDPLVNAERQLGEAMTAGGRAEMRAAVTGILELGDSHLLALLPGAGRRVIPQPGSGDVAREDQAPLDPAELDELLADASVALAACRDGIPCDFDVLMQMQCLGAAICDATREGHIRTWLAMGRIAAQDIDRLPALVERARRAMAEKDVDFFLR